MPDEVQSSYSQTLDLGQTFDLEMFEDRLIFINVTTLYHSSFSLSAMTNVLSATFFVQFFLSAKVKNLLTN